MESIIDSISKQFSKLSTRLSKHHAYELSSELAELELTYSSMLHYMLQGINDANQTSIYSDIRRRCKTLANRISRLDRLSSYPETKYTITANKTSLRNIQEILIILSDKCRQLRLLEQSPNGNPHIREQKYSECISQRQYELNYLFNKLWSGDILSKSDYTDLHDAFDSDTLYEYDKCAILSGLTLGLSEMFDERKLMCLFDLYESSDPNLSMRSLVGIVLTLIQYDSYIDYYPSIKSRLSLLFDNPLFIKDTYLVLLQLEYSSLTNKISDKMRNDIIPTLMESGKFKKTPFGLKEIDDYMTQNGENPEWHQIDKDEKAFSKLQEITELQMEGADVYMSTFQYLKNDSFFSDISNWFMPFSKDHPILHSTLNEMPKLQHFIKSILFNAPFCNSDKYSFAFMLRNTGSIGQEMLVNNISGDINSDELNDHIKDMIEESKKRSDISRKYIQDIYRFYTLYPFHNQFNNPFKEQQKTFNPIATKCLVPILSYKEDLILLADFFMRKELYTDAEELYDSLLSQNNSTDSTIWQKIGFCQQKSGKLSEALKSYSNSFSLNSDSTWTLKHLARVNYLLKQYKESEVYYDMLLIGDENNIHYLKCKADCLIKSEQYEEAVSILYKLHYLDEDSSQILKELGKCLFMVKKFDKSRTIYKSLLNKFSNDAEIMIYLSINDYCTNDYISSYSYLSNAYHILSAETDGMSKFSLLYTELKQKLNSLEIDPTKYQMICDAVFMNIQ